MIDQARFKPEVARAIEQNGLLPEMLTPGLAVDFRDGAFHILEAGSDEPVGVVPLYRLEAVDLDLCKAVAINMAERTCTTTVADQFAAEVAAGLVEFIDNPEGDDVAVIARGEQLMAIHRAHVVPSWPKEAA